MRSVVQVLVLVVLEIGLDIEIGPILGMLSLRVWPMEESHRLGACLST